MPSRLMAFTLEKLKPSSRWSRRLQAWGIKLAWWLLMGTLLGAGYHWAIPRLYRPESKAGICLGAIHGFLMPVALPNLLAGQDVPIFAVNNTGRAYKLGYIAGINLCGLVFFGLAFRVRPENSHVAPGTPLQNSQFRNTSITSTRPPDQ